MNERITNVSKNEGKLELYCVPENNFASEVNILFMSEVIKFATEKTSNFPSITQYYWESKVCSQPTDLFAWQLCYQCNLSISTAKVQASEEAETGITHREQVFTAFNSESPRYSRTPKKKDQNWNSNDGFSFHVGGEKRFKKHWSILMKNLLDTMNYELFTFEKLYSLLTKLH